MWFYLESSAFLMLVFPILSSTDVTVVDSGSNSALQGRNSFLSSSCNLSSLLLKRSLTRRQMVLSEPELYIAQALKGVKPAWLLSDTDALIWLHEIWVPFAPVSPARLFGYGVMETWSKLCLQSTFARSVQQSWWFMDSEWGNCDRACIGNSSWDDSLFKCFIQFSNFTFTRRIHKIL